MYVCHCVGTLIPFAIAATLFMISVPVLRIRLELEEGCQAKTPLTTAFWGFQNVVTAGLGDMHIRCVCVCVSVSVCLCACMVRGIEGDWQTVPAPESLSLSAPLSAFSLPPPTLCLHLWLCKPPHYVGALKWQWKLWLIFVKTHSLPPRFRMKVRW